MRQNVSNDTPIAMLTVGQLKEVMGSARVTPAHELTQKTERRYLYGYKGVAELFNCSIPTAARIKASGKIDGAIKQIGRKIIVDADLALELAGRKTGGRR
jgi:hypothetical protein